MAEFQEQVMGLTGLTIDASSTAPSRAEFTTFLTDGAKEIINVLPPQLKEKCMTESTITNSPSYLADLDGIGEILHVTRLSADSGGYRIPCRKVLSMYGEMTGDSNNLMYYASVTDPSYWITSSNDATILNVNPTPTANQTAIVYHVAYPTVAYNDEVIANFPDEAEYLVTLYAACKSLQSTMGGMNSNTAIDTTAFAAIASELGETQTVCDSINSKVDLAATEIGKAVTFAAEMTTQTANSDDMEAACDAINTAVDKFRADGGDPALFGDETQYTTGTGLTHVKDALDKARTLLSDDAEHAGLTDVTDEPTSGTYSVLYWLGDEDTEMAEATMKMVVTEMERAKMHIEEWNAAVQALGMEIDGFSKEVAARAAFTGAKEKTVKSIIVEASAYIAAAQGYASEVQAKINIAQGYIAEANVRMARDTQKYQWYQTQQATLQADYYRGIQLLSSGKLQTKRPEAKVEQK